MKKLINNSTLNLFDVNSLFEFSRIVNSSADLGFILNHFLLTVMGKLVCSKGIILLRKDEKLFRVAAVRGMPAELVSTNLNIINPPKSIIYQNMIKNRKETWTKYFIKNDVNIIVPLVSKNRILGIAGFHKVVSGKLKEEEKAYLQSVVNITTVAIEQRLVIDELQIINKELDRKIHQMNTIFDLGKELTTIFERDKLIKLFMLSLMGQIGTGQFAICLKENNEIKVAASRLGRPINSKLLNILCKYDIPISIDISNDKKIKSQLLKNGIHTIIPMKIHNETKGILLLGEKMNSTPYTQGDLEFLFSLGNLAVISLENSRLFAEAIEKQKMEDELIIAREIQKGLLPKKIPRFNGFDIAAVNISSKQVGGDYYDIIDCGDNKFIIAIGDVSGKGTPASLLMANLQAMIRALVPLGLPLSELTSRVNNLLHNSTSDDRFITFFWGCVDSRTNSLEFVNAGHNLPIIFHKDNSIERLEIGGLILGVMKTVIPYNQGITTLKEGDILVLFTDGVVEAMNSKGIEYGEEKLISVIETNSDKSAQIILDNIVESVQLHSGDSQSDDITVLVLKVK